MRSLPLFLLALFTFSPFAHAEVAADAPERPPLRKLEALVYGKQSGKDLKLDLMLPPEPLADPQAKLPLIIYIHGGGWREGHRGFCPVANLARRGYAVATISYRFVQVAIFPAQIQDCQAALRWLRVHAAEYQIDPDRVGVVGESAGGVLAALLGTCSDVAALQDPAAVDAGVPLRVQAVISLCGPSDFLGSGDPTEPPLAQLLASTKPQDLELAKTIVGRQVIMAGLFGGAPDEHPELARLASPIYHVSADDPPVLLIHGDRDHLVPYAQSVNFQAALKAAGVEAELITIPGAKHGFGRLKPQIYDQVRAFLDRHLHPKN